MTFQVDVSLLTTTWGSIQTPSRIQQGSLSFQIYPLHAQVCMASEYLFSTTPSLPPDYKYNKYHSVSASVLGAT